MPFYEWRDLKEFNLSNPLNYSLEQLNNRTELLYTMIRTLGTNDDTFFLLMMGCIILLMQCGFAFLEAGSVRARNTVNILTKNLLDSAIAAVSYYVIGWALGFGKSVGGVFGFSQFGLAGLEYTEYPHWFFQFTFAATAATIVSGALAERCDFVAYFCYSAVLTGFVYPVIVHWAWSPDGWLNLLGFKDYSGSGVVHLHGATCALVGAIILGPRIGRFPTKDRKVIEMPGHSVPFAALGGFLLIFGFLAFNGGSRLSLSGPKDGPVIAQSMINTIISGSCATLTTIFVGRVLHRRWSLLKAINAFVAGMVAACAGCASGNPWPSLILGAGAGLCCEAIAMLMVRLRIDDPVDSVAVHGGGGLWGLLTKPLADGGIAYAETWRVFGVNFLGAIAIIGWSTAIVAPMFLVLKRFGLFRVSEEVELKGLDIYKHGEPAYPLAAYGHGWDDKIHAKPSMMDIGGIVPTDGSPEAHHLGDVAARSRAKRIGPMTEETPAFELGHNGGKAETKDL